MLSIKNLSAGYQHKPVFENLNLEIKKGSLVGILGPNGAGKSTLIKAIINTIPILKGGITLNGHPVKQQLKKIGYVPQRENIDWDFPVTALEVVMMGQYVHLGLFKRFKSLHRKEAFDALDQMGIAKFANHQIGNLSGGQQQRVFLARALVQKSDIYLLDEPFTGVDASTEAEIVKLLKEMNQRGKMILVVHHNLTTAKDYFDYLILLNAGLVAYGKSEAVFNQEALEKTYGGTLPILTRLS